MRNCFEIVIPGLNWNPVRTSDCRSTPSLKNEPDSRLRGHDELKRLRGPTYHAFHFQFTFRLPLFANYKWLQIKFMVPWSVATQQWTNEV